MGRFTDGMIEEDSFSDRIENLETLAEKQSKQIENLRGLCSQTQTETEWIVKKLDTKFAKLNDLKDIRDAIKSKFSESSESQKTSLEERCNDLETMLSKRFESIESRISNLEKKDRSSSQRRINNQIDDVIIINTTQQSQSQTLPSQNKSKQSKLDQEDQNFDPSAQLRQQSQQKETATEYRARTALLTRVARLEAWIEEKFGTYSENLESTVSQLAKYSKNIVDERIENLVHVLDNYFIDKLKLYSSTNLTVDSTNENGQFAWSKIICQQFIDHSTQMHKLDDIIQSVEYRIAELSNTHTKQQTVTKLLESNLSRAILNLHEEAIIDKRKLLQEFQNQTEILNQRILEFKQQSKDRSSQSLTLSDNKKDDQLPKRKSSRKQFQNKPVNISNSNSLSAATLSDSQRQIFPINEADQTNLIDSNTENNRASNSTTELGYSISQSLDHSSRYRTSQAQQEPSTYVNHDQISIDSIDQSPIVATENEVAYTTVQKSLKNNLQNNSNDPLSESIISKSQDASGPGLVPDNQIHESSDSITNSTGLIKPKSRKSRIRTKLRVVQKPSQIVAASPIMLPISEAKEQNLIGSESDASDQQGKRLSSNAQDLDYHIDRLRKEIESDDSLNNKDFVLSWNRIYDLLTNVFDSMSSNQGQISDAKENNKYGVVARQSCLDALRRVQAVVRFQGENHNDQSEDHEKVYDEIILKASDSVANLLTTYLDNDTSQYLKDV